MSNTAVADTVSTNGTTTHSGEEIPDVRVADTMETLTVEALHQGLQDAGYICGKDRAQAVLAALLTDPLGGFFAFGPPGTGKTWLFEVLAEILGFEKFFKQVTPGSREEDLILDLLPDEDKKSGIKKQHGVLVQAVRATHEGPVMMILDEWDKTRPTADAFLLDFLQTGRINYGDVQEQANMDNLYVGITLNEERDLSGPLHRRLPFLNFDPLHPSLVRQALVNSHGKNPFIEAAVNLYVRCELSMMEKPATIQELRQLLDAATRLGENADWNALVYQYVTKDKDNHRLLKNAEGLDVDDWGEQEDIDPLDPEIYGKVDVDGNPTQQRSGMPTMAEMKGYTATESEKTPDLASSFAALQNREATYDTLTTLEPASDDPNSFGRVMVAGDTITFEEPVALTDHKEYVGELWGHPGEVVFVEETATEKDMRLLQSERALEFISYTEDEIIARKVQPDAQNIHIRWTSSDGAEIICPTDERVPFKNLFVGTWLTDPYVEGYELPTEVIARLGMEQAGTVSVRHEDVEIASPYYAGVFDEWQAMGINSAEAIDIPKYNDFLELAEKGGRVEGGPEGSLFVFFENVMLGFLGQDNDYLVVSITGTFNHRLNEYLQDYLPHGKLFLARKVKTEITEDDLIKDHGFQIARASKRRQNPNRTLSRMKDGIKSVYRDGEIRIGAQLSGEKVTHDRASVIIERIDNTISSFTSK